MLNRLNLLFPTPSTLQEGLAAVIMATEKGYVAIVEKLVNTGKLDVNLQDKVSSLFFSKDF